MGTAKMHPLPDRVKPSFAIFDIRALWRLAPSVRVLGCQKRLTPCGTACSIAVPIYGNSGRQRVLHNFTITTTKLDNETSVLWRVW